MEALKIEILNPKALQFISLLKAYLKKSRQNADKTLSFDEITNIVEDVRAKRYAKK
jgi:hypothetical protein